MFDCSLRVLVHAWIDTLMHHHSQSLLPLTVFVWVVAITMSIRDTLMPLNTSETSREHRSTSSTIHLHRTTLPSVGACEHCSWHRRSTPLQAYSCRDNTLSHRVEHITILGVPGWVPTEYEWPDLWTLFHLGCDPSLQVWLPEKGESEPCTFVSEELAGWIGRLCTPGRSWTPCSPNHTRITGVLYTLLSHCAPPRLKLKPSMSVDVHHLLETLDPFPEA